jgi:hypothetical protein
MITNIDKHLATLAKKKKKVQITKIKSKKRGLVFDLLERKRIIRKLYEQLLTDELGNSGNG